MAERLPRHTMAMASPSAWTALMLQRPDLAEQPLVARWGRDGHPLVVRRPGCGDSAELVPLGLPLPPSQGKLRVALALPRDQIVKVEPPPLLAEAAGAAPHHWVETIGHLVQLDPHTRTFGSLAWQSLTGLQYLSAGSDLDLLWRLPATADIPALLNGIATIARRAPMRIDGEVVSAAGGVQWRELADDDRDEVLVKGFANTRMMSRADFLSGAAQ